MTITTRDQIISALANLSNVAGWAQIGLPEVPNDACLFPIILPPWTYTGTLRGGGKIVHG